MSKEMKCIWYEEDNFVDFLNQLLRAEYAENPRVYTKAIRATLIALGYDERYVEGAFRDILEKYFKKTVGV